MEKEFAQMMSKFTGMGRGIFPTYLPNLIFLAITGLIGIIVVGIEISNGADIFAAIEAAIWPVAAVGASWVIARELDPEHDYSAFVGIIPALLLVDGDIGLWTIGAAIMMARIISRVVGPPVYIGDSIVATIVIGFAVFTSGGWLIGMMGVVTFILDAVLNAPQKHQYIFAAIMSAITIAFITIEGISALTLPSILPLAGIAIITVGYLWKVSTTESINLEADYGPEYTVNQQRVKASMIFSVIGFFAISLWGGDSTLQTIFPIWTALGGIVVYWLGMQLLSSNASLKPLLSNLFR